MRHLKLVTSTNQNTENLSYDELENKIQGLMAVLDTIQDVGMEDEFPLIENKIRYYIGLQQDLIPTPPEAPASSEDPSESNLVDLSALFAFKKFMNSKNKTEEQSETPQNVLRMSKWTSTDSDDAG